MALECPSCHRVSPVDSLFCPVCGAPMTEEAERARQNARANGHIAGLLPMRWHRFLIWVLLPLGLLTGGINLYDSITMAVQFDAALFRPEMLSLVQFNVFLNVVFSALLLPLLAVTEVSMLRMKKRGPKLLLWMYLFQAVYGLINLMLLWQAGVKDISFVSAAVSALEMMVMCAANRAYYKKRQELFH